MKQKLSLQSVKPTKSGRREVTSKESLVPRSERWITLVCNECVTISTQIYPMTDESARGGRFEVLMNELFSYYASLISLCPYRSFWSVSL